VSLLASGLDSPLGLELDATHAYVSTIQVSNAKLLRVDSSTAEVKELFVSKGIFDVALDGAAVYFGAGEGGAFSIRRLPKSGGAAEVIANLTSTCLVIDVDASHAYWTTTSGELQRVAKTGGTVQTLHSGPGPAVGLVLDAGHVYVAFEGTQGKSSTDGRIVRIAKAAPHAALTLADQQRAPYQAAIHAGMLYFTTRGDGANGAVARVPLDGSSAPEVVVANLANPRGVAIAGDTLFYSQGAPQSSLWRVALAGGTPSIVPAQIFNADRILARDGFVYGTDVAPDFGSVWRAAP
jgi:hypothetical protein